MPTQATELDRPQATGVCDAAILTKVLAAPPDAWAGLWSEVPDASTAIGADPDAAQATWSDWHNWRNRW